jgi:hypothetical protein
MENQQTGRSPRLGPGLGFAAGLVLAAALAGSVSAAPAAPPEPVAIVESVQGNPAGLAKLDYLVAGRQLTLAAGQSVVIDYLHSCEREAISGGSATIGKEQSDVAGGEVRRARIECDGNPRGRAEQPAPVATTPQLVPPPKPEGQPHDTGVKRTLYSTAPLVDLRGAGKLTIEPLDPTGPATSLDLAAGDLVAGRFYDFATSGQTLRPGSLYRAVARGQAILFLIDPLARESGGPPGGRLLRF